MNSALSATAIFLETLGPSIYYLALGISFFESLAFIGLIVPSTALLIGAGFLVSWHFVRGEILLGAVVLGGLLGDIASFYLGSRGVEWFKPGNRLFKLEYLTRGKEFFARHGAKSIVFARFLSPLRPIIPFVAGLFDMSRSRFALYAFLGCIGSSVLYIGIGFVLGTLSDRSFLALTSLEHWLLGLGVIIVLGYLVRRFLFRRGKAVFAAIGSFIKATGSVMVRAAPVRLLLAKHQRLAMWLNARPHRYGCVFLGIGSSLVVPFFVVLPWLSDWLESPFVQTFDISVLSQWFAWRSSSSTFVALGWTFFGSPSVLCIITFLLLVWLVRAKKYLVALGGAVSMAGVAVTVMALKHLVERARPDAVIAVYQETSFSFPSGHAALSLTCFLFVGYVLCMRTPLWHRKVNIIFTAVCLALAVGLSRVFLGVHYPSDVIAGWIIGLGWFLLGIGLERVAYVRRTP
jgi:undecaprenyl-diphosphatase